MSTNVFMMALISLTLLTATAQAQSEKGNGGHTVKCNGKVLMFDTYEGYRAGFTPDLGDSNDSVRTKVNLMINRIRPFLPVLADQLVESTNGFIVDIENYPNLATRVLPNGVRVKIGAKALWSDDPLYFVADLGAGFKPGGGCEPGFSIRNQEVRVPSNREFEIFMPDWELMDNDQRAIAVMHEELYRRTRKAGDTDSLFARYLNQLLFDGTQLNVTPCQYFANLHNLSFAKITAASGTVKCDLTGMLSSAELGLRMSIDWRVKSIQSARADYYLLLEKLDPNSSAILHWHKEYGACVSRRSDVVSYYLELEEKPYPVTVGPTSFFQVGEFTVKAYRQDLTLNCKTDRSGKVRYVGDWGNAEKVPLTATIDFLKNETRFSDGKTVKNNDVGVKLREWLGF